MNLFDLSLRLNNFPIQRAKRRLSEIKTLDDVEYERYITSQKREIVKFHLEKNKFYKSLVTEADTNDWAKLPVMTKRNLQVPLAKRLTNGYTAKNVYVNKTSGSSGDPFIFAKDRFCHAMTWAVIQDRFSWYDLDFNKSLQARFYGIPLDLSGYYKERLKDSMSHRYRFSVFDLSDSAFKKCLNRFRTTSFKYINGYTSSIVQFAKYLDRNNVVLKSICPSLECCIVTSEMLFEDDKNIMEEYFGVPIINEYGASELDLIAFEDPSGDWRLNIETLFIEILDKNDQVLPNGEEGRIVITSLFNKAHPFIRYDIGDIGIIDKEPVSKKPLLRKLIGRTNDIAFLPSGKKAAGLTFYYITKRIIEDDGNVKEFIIIQSDLDTFKINYVSMHEIPETQKLLIRNEMAKYLEDGLTIIFNREDRLIRSKSGKLKQFTSEIRL